MESVKGLRKFFNQKMVTLLILAVIVILTFTILSGGDYLKVSNIRAILNLMSVTGLLTIGVGCLIIAGYIDLSTGSIGTMSCVLLALFLREGIPWPVTVVACLLVGMLIGGFNAVLVNVFGFQPFIATMAVASISQGLAFTFCNGQSIPVRDRVVTYIGTGRIFDVIPIAILVLLVCFIVYGLILSKSKFGRSVYLVGGNQQAARLSGIHPVRISYILFINSGMLAALAGMLLAARLKSGSTAGITSSQFTGITAAMLGGISFGGGSGSLAGVFVGLLIITGFSNGLSVLGVISFWQTFASGALLLFALTLDYLYGRRMQRSVAVGA